MKKSKLLISVAVTLLLIISGLSAALADPGWPPPKPKIITVATYKVGSVTHYRTAMMSECISKKFGVTMRVVPIGTDVARAMSVKTKSADAWVTGSGVYSTSEAVGEYGTSKWGPQPVRYAYICNRQTGFGPATTKKSGIKTMDDARGKRVALIVGNPGIQLQTKAWLAFGGLRLEDVELVKFPSYTSQVRGLMEGKVDVASISPDAPIAGELESSPRGGYWIPLPHSNVKGWKRMQAIFPLCNPVLISIGHGIDPKKPIEYVTVAAPAFITFDWADEGTVYWMTKLIAESYEGMDYPSWWTLDENLRAARCAPFHKGAVKYYKEKGKWTAELKKLDQSYLKRQVLLKETFEAAKVEARKKGVKDKKFPDFWQKKRTEALERTGL